MSYRTNYTESDDAFIIKNYATLGSATCGKALKRKGRSIEIRASKLRKMGYSIPLRKRGVKKHLTI